ncbi:hypothetical protein Ciccas_014220 [Cichlidogyrus casuarinus]|uniref:Uncharacterized protein n=1 Tax=Cichlidogyrus casuarinus TaxID=1844966 RepID=A0ABD2PLI9_9PLAT
MSGVEGMAPLAGTPGAGLDGTEGAVPREAGGGGAPLLDAPGDGGAPPILGATRPPKLLVELSGCNKNTKSASSFRQSQPTLQLLTVEITRSD